MPDSQAFNKLFAKVYTATSTVQAMDWDHNFHTACGGKCIHPAHSYCWQWNGIQPACPYCWQWKGIQHACPYTADGGKGYTLHVHTAGGGKAYGAQTFHIGLLRIGYETYRY